MSLCRKIQQTVTYFMNLKHSGPSELLSYFIHSLVTSNQPTSLSQLSTLTHRFPLPSSGFGHDSTSYLCLGSCLRANPPPEPNFKVDISRSMLRGSSKFQLYLLRTRLECRFSPQTLTKYYCILIHKRLLNYVSVIC